MKIIADTNTFLAVVLNEPEKSEIIRLTTGYDLVAPLILPFEIGNALSAMLKRRRLNSDEVLSAWNSVQTIPVELRKIDVRRVLEIAVHLNIYAYDAYFLECAVELQLPLLSLDRHLCTSAQKLNIRMLEINQ